MRVLTLSTLFPSPARTAFGRFVAAQTAALAARGDVAVTVINPVGLPPFPLSRATAYRAARKTPARSSADGFDVYHPRFTLLPLIGGDSNPARIVRAVLPLARRMHAAAPFDLVDAQFFFPDGPASAAIARALGLPLAIKARGSDIHYWGTRPNAAAQMLEAAAQADQLLAVSAALAGDMAALGMPADGIAVHYTGLDHARFHPVPRAAARAQLPGIPPHGPLLTVPGALIAIKGQRLAIEALGELPDAALALAGAGSDEAELRTLAARLGLGDRVHFLGQVEHDALPRLLAASDVVVLPSQREGLANAWIEALACGTPLVIPDVGGAREVIRTPSAGRIAARNAAAIAAAVREVLAAGYSQAEVAANAARFSWQTNAAQLAAHYARIAG